MNKMRKETKTGILGLTIYLVFKFAGTYIGEITTSNILNFVMGMCLGLSIICIIIGMLSQNAYNKLKCWKTDIFKAR